MRRLKVRENHIGCLVAKLMSNLEQSQRRYLLLDANVNFATLQQNISIKER